MNTAEYQERQEAKAEYYKDKAEALKSASQSAYNRSKAISDLIPMGQPILIGHHSEARHRRDIDRIQNSFNKSIELREKAEYYEHKAENAINNNNISSDNPEALKLLKEKLEALEQKRAELKKDKNKPAYVLPNLAGQIRQVRERIKQLEATASIEDKEEVINGITLKLDKQDNRVKIIFPDIPSEEVRAKLKSYGFHWSPYNQAWQRQLNNSAIFWAKSIIEGVGQ